MPPKRIILKSSSASNTSTEFGTSASKKSKRRANRSPSPQKRQSPSRTRSSKKEAVPSSDSLDSSDSPGSAESTESSESGPESGPESDISLSLSSPSEDDSLSENQASKLTARQRSLLDSTLSTPSLELLVPRELTEEEQLRKSEKSRRRKNLRDQKLEQSKADTIQRLLKKQSVRSKKMRTQESSNEQDKGEVEVIKSDGIRTVMTKHGSTLTHGGNLPCLRQGPVEYPKITTCQVKGCRNPRKYSHSRSKISICSLKCYQASDAQ